MQVSLQNRHRATSPHMPSSHSPPRALAGSVCPWLSTSCCNMLMLRLIPWMTWTRQQVRSHRQNGQLQPKHLAGQAFKVLRPLRACTVEKEMKAPLTGVLEKDTGSNLRSKIFTKLTWEHREPQHVFGMRAVTSSNSSGFHPWIKYVLYPQLWVLPLQWKSQ